MYGVEDLEPKLLVTGINSGLGKYLHRHFKCDGFARGDSLPTTKYHTVVHCAVSTIKDVSHDNLGAYLDDNVALTQRLCSSLLYEKFIYISTVDVYPHRGDHYWEESDKIVLSTSPPLLSVYATTKLISEAVVTNCPNWLILRCSTLLNIYARSANATMTILDTTKHGNIFLHGSSVACFVLVSDIARLIEMSLRDDLTGIYNVAGTEYTSLYNMVEFLGSDITFGNYVYSLGKASNAKVCKIAPFFDKTFCESIEQFKKELGSPR